MAFKNTLGLLGVRVGEGEELRGEVGELVRVDARARRGGLGRAGALRARGREVAERAGFVDNS